jgi:D-alanyl-D-alanine carboxypeptidase/D-alanyl-D-alanine-endopeptidase (penicillin-binding protein 4)
VSLKGRYPTACGAQPWPIHWPQAQLMEHSARVFTAAWQQMGGRLKGVVREGTWPESTVPWVKWSSPPLAEVIRDINKYSNNVMARQVFLTLGRGTDGSRATLEQARSVVASHVREATRRAGEPNSPCDGEALALDNGAGLSRIEVASPHCLARWIEVMWADPLMPEWLASLPVAGVDGTARRMTSAVGRAHLKTGSLDDVTALAGVVQDETGRRHVVVAVVNDPKAEGARPVMQAVLAWAASSQGAP